jgi:mannose/fructose/N-acetylgalactosamine-specific phosphotransferase system component IIC
MTALLLTFLGSFLALDKYALGEFGISQPLISGTIIGAICGDIGTGILLGAIFQLICLGGLPIGREIPPDAQSAGIVGCGTYFLLAASNSHGHALLVATLFAFLASILGGTTDIVLRHINDRLYERFSRNEKRLYASHFLGLATSFVRAFAIYLPPFLIASLIKLPSHFPQLSQELFIIIGISMGVANASYLFIKKSAIIYTIAGALCGLALLVF